MIVLYSVLLAIVLAIVLGVVVGFSMWLYDFCEKRMTVGLYFTMSMVLLFLGLICISYLMLSNSKGFPV